MKILFWIFLLTLFSYINLKIVYTDRIQQKIPNRDLLFLLLLIPFWYIYGFVFWIFWNIDITLFIVQILITLGVWFWIYFADIWWAGDAKYVCVLWLFIPHIWILSFIWNIWVVTLGYLLVYFLWFWFWKNLWIKQRRQDFLTNIWIIKKNQFLHKHWKQTTREVIFELLKSLNIFLLAFLALRFFRFFLLAHLWNTYDVVSLLQQYGMYLLVASIVLTFALIIIMKKIYHVLKKFVFRSKKDEVYFLCFISIIWIILLLYWYSLNPQYFSEKIILIFTLYLFLYLIFRFFWEACKITFKMQEQPLVHVDDIKEGMIIDKEWFDLILARDRDIFWNIQLSGSMLSKDDVEIVQRVIRKVNETQDQPHIPIYKTFGFAICIFGWFVVTYIFDSLIIRILIELYKIIIT